MYIYIDESGIFANPNGKDTAVSCVAALVIPEPFQKYIFKSLKHLKKNWGSTREETKGSRLDERQVAQVATLLGKYDVILKACVIDMGTHSDSDIAAHKQGQAEAFTKNITPEFHPNLVRQLEELKERVRRLPDQLYVQSCVLTSLVESIIKRLGNSTTCCNHISLTGTFLCYQNGIMECWNNGMLEIKLKGIIF